MVLMGKKRAKVKCYTPIRKHISRVKMPQEDGENVKTAHVDRYDDNLHRILEGNP